MNSEKNTLISVIIPCYNSSNHINRIINSLNNQTYKNLEIILIDDGSTDDTKSTILNLIEGDKRYKLITQKNLGVSKSRNKGILASSGNYICFLDSDDHIDNDYMYKLINKALKDDLDLVFCGYRNKNENECIVSNYLSRYRYIDKNIDGISLLKEVLKGNIHIFMLNFIIKKSILINNNIIFNPSCYYGEDQELVMKALTHCNLTGCVNEELSSYYNISTSAMHTFSVKRFSSIGAMNRVKKYMEIYNDKELLFLSNNRLCMEFIYLYNNYKKYRLAQDFDYIFDGIRIKFSKQLVKYKPYSKKTIKYYILVNIFLVSKELYSKLFGSYFKK